ncbi:uncharacterized protein LOC129741186 [Uranotaenia lowii]|uniref:uncharacterized protein LOC129741186 n=1 Tax=Uranotaenia lowii TaxID=190385 RepID=UPI002479D84F|nr:uncharacterized protein LOC129741186 [Uranotaenia lowii]
MNVRRCWIFLLYIVSADLVLARIRNIRNIYQQKCAARLESALDTTLRRSQQRSGFGTLIDFSDSAPQKQALFNRSPYNNYEDDIQQIVSEYKQKYKGSPKPSSTAASNAFFPPSGLTATSQVEVTNLKVRIPHNHHWVMVDRCQYVEHNRTLDTKLGFPDLQISGRVIMHPSGGRCDMILRLRHAGIEFRTIPLLRTGFGERSRQANVRTDSHFSEPGFISVFAHSCEGPTGIKYRINSKRRHFLNRQPTAGYDGFYNRDYANEYQRNMEHKRSLRFVDDDNDDDLINDYTSDDIFKLNDDDSLFMSPSTFVDVAGDYDGPADTNSRTLFGSGPATGTGTGSGSGPHGGGGYGGTDRIPFAYNAYAGNGAGWQTVETNEALDDAYANEIDGLFSKGVRGLLTTYMQKALQPAIKETLMESMGYTLSYG